MKLQKLILRLKILKKLNCRIEVIEWPQLVFSEWCLNDPNQVKQFLLECYQEILEERRAMEEHFGKELVLEIEQFKESTPVRSGQALIL